MSRVGLETLAKIVATIGAVLLCSVSHRDANAANTDLFVSLTASPSPASVGTNLTYTISVVVPAGGASGVTVTDILPSTAVYVSSSAGCSVNLNNPSSPATSSGTVTCLLGSLAAGTSTVTIVAKPTVVGTVQNVVGVVGDQYDPSIANNSATATTLVTGGVTVTSVNPTIVPLAGNVRVAVYGSGFTGATRVQFGGVDGTSIGVGDDTSLVVTAPAHAAGAVDVVVTSPKGVGVLPGGLTYSGAPLITGVQLPFGPLAGNRQVKILGGGLTGASRVTFGGVDALGFHVDSDVQITATTPPHAAGPVDVVVVTPAGVATAKNGYSYWPAPTLSSISPTTGKATGGTSVTINGANFQPLMRVTFGGVDATLPVWATTSQIIVTTNAHAAGIVDVTVVNPDLQSATLSGAFTYTPSRIAGIRPPTPPSVGGTQTATSIVDLDQPAPAGGAVVGLTSDKAAAIVPATVTVPQGAMSSAPFTINTTVVSTTTTALLTASYGGTASTNLTVLSPAFEGFVDGSDCTNISGWAWDSYRPNTSIAVDILADGVPIAWSVPANIYRPDLVAAGKGNGIHGFGYALPSSLKDGHTHSLAVYYSGSVPPTQLGWSPRSITCPPPSVSIAWVMPAEVTWGPAGTLTVAGYAQNGTGGVTMYWRDATIGSGWNVVAYAPLPDATHVWYNTIPNSNNCHTYQVYATYSGVTSATFSWVGATSGYCVSSIQVSSATYGANCGAPIGNATWSVAPACNGKSSCSYTVSYTTLGDPAPGCAKDFRASWTCSGGTSPAPAFAPAEAGFGSVVTLRCP